MTKCIQELNQIAPSISTSLGGGKHCHLGLLMNDTEYMKTSDGGATFFDPSILGYIQQQGQKSSPNIRNSWENMKFLPGWRSTERAHRKSGWFGLVSWNWWWNSLVHQCYCTLNDYSPLQLWKECRLHWHKVIVGNMRDLGTSLNTPLFISIMSSRSTSNLAKLE